MAIPRALPFAAVLALTAGLAHAQVYQWKDAQGVTHYSDAPPPKGQYDARYIHNQVPAPVPAPASASATADAPAGQAADAPADAAERGPLVLTGPPSVTGFAGGRPQVEEIVAYWPALVSRDRIEAHVAVEML